MNTPATAPPTGDPTLTITPHAVSVIVGALFGWIATKLHLTVDAATQAQLTGIVAAAFASVSHWVMAKISALGG